MKRNYEEIENIVNELGYELLDEHTFKHKRRVTIKDSNGYRWEGDLNRLVRNNGKVGVFHIENIYTLENIFLWLILNRPDVELCDGNTYSGSMQNLVFFHNIEDCQEKFNMSWASLSRGIGCPVCSGMQVGERNSLAYLRPDLVKEWHPDNNLNPKEVPCGSNERAYWVCSECGYGENGDWNSIIANRSNGQGCPACSNPPKVLTDRNRLSIRFPDIAKEWDYEKNSDTPYEVSFGSDKKRHWICRNGHSYYSKICSRTSGSSCPECNFPKGESRISSWVEDNISNLKKTGIIGCTPQKSFYDCRDKNPLEFDFGFEYSDSTWAMTEFQGEQHFFPIDFAGRGEKWAEEEFRKSQRRDEIKRKYCEYNNIQLLIIPYWEIDNIEKILEKEFLIR